MVAAAARPVRRRVPLGSGWRWARAPTSRPGPGRPATGPSARMRPPATPPTTRPRRCWSICCAAPGSTAWPPCGPGRAIPLLALRRAETVALCDELGLDPGPRPEQRATRGSSATGSATSWCRCVRPSPGVTWCRFWPARPALLAGDADILDAVASLIDPEDAAALAGAPAAGRAAGAVRDWLAGHGPYPPPLDAVERVLDVARKERRATETPGGQRVRRRAAGSRSTAAGLGPTRLRRPTTALRYSRGGDQPEGMRWPTTRPPGTRSLEHGHGVGRVIVSEVDLQARIVELGSGSPPTTPVGRRC